MLSFLRLRGLAAILECILCLTVLYFFINFVLAPLCWWPGIGKDTYCSLITNGQPSWATRAGSYAVDTYCSTATKLWPGRKWCDMEEETSQHKTHLIDVQAKLDKQFEDITSLVQASFRVNDAMSYDLQQILLGVNDMSAVVSGSNLSPALKALAFDLLSSIRKSARGSNDCIQGYLAELRQGVNIIAASADYTIRLVGVYPPPHIHVSSDLASLSNYPSTPQEVALMRTFSSLDSFSRHLTESNQRCRHVHKDLESKINHVNEVMVNKASIYAQKSYDDANSYFWGIFGGKPSLKSAEKQLEAVERMSRGFRRLASSSVFLDLHLQKLAAGSTELGKQAQRLRQAAMPVEEIMYLVRKGCRALQEVAQGGDVGSQKVDGNEDAAHIVSAGY